MRACGPERTLSPMPTPRIRSFALGTFQTNCFIVDVPDAAAPEDSRPCWIVDCGESPGPMLDAVEREGLSPVALLLTHTHCDHMAGVSEARRRFPGLPVHVHESEAGFLPEPMLNLSVGLGTPISCEEAEHFLKDGEILELSGTRWRVIHLPGHSPGGCAFLHEESGQMISGDTLFAGSMGRVDFPTSDEDDMRASLRRLMELPDTTIVHPGHGPATTIGRERESNPYIER